MRRLWYNATVASMDGNMNAYQAIGTDGIKIVQQRGCRASKLGREAQYERGYDIARIQ